MNPDAVAPSSDERARPYEEFLLGKVRSFDGGGIDVQESDLPDWLFPFQKRIVATALRKGRFAVFADTGLGKTRMQLAVAAHLAGPGHRHRSLILCPLAVAGQTIAEAESLGLSVGRPGSTADIHVVNYDRLDEVDPAQYGAVLLDESSILKNFSGSTKRALCEAFADTRYRFCFTATPAPNDHAELGNHSQFLGVMDSPEMLMRFFAVDQGKAGNYRLKGHARADFWRWVASWAVALRKPSDLGDFGDEGYDLPPLRIVRHTVATEATEGALVSDAALSATTLHRDKRRTSPARAEMVASIVQAEPEEPWLVWCDTDYEAADLRERLPRVAEVSGSMAAAVKESRLLGFAKGDPFDLMTKASIAGFGMNWQHCARMVAYLNYSFEGLYQLVRRCWRFGQARPVEVHIVCADSEWSVVESIEAKREAHERMVAEMVAAVRRGSDGGAYDLVRAVPYRRSQGEGWILEQGDSCETIRGVESDSVGLSVFSPPFSNLYTYSDALADMGNCEDDDEFLEHFGFLAPELLRVTQPGRLCAIHCKHLPRYLGKDGAVGLRDFPGEIRAVMEWAGWTFHSWVTVWKCPVTERERTNNNGLLHKTVCRDRTQLRTGMADFVLVLRKAPAEGNMADEPVGTPDGFTNYVGDPLEDPRTSNAHPSPYARRLSGRPSIDVWRRYAEPVWWDIDQMDVLNVKLAREDEDEKHICPLQLGLIRRIVDLWSNPGDLVYSPFTGIGSDGVVPIQEGRRFRGGELKPAYFDQAVRNITQAERDGGRQMDLFSGEGGPCQ